MSSARVSNPASIIKTRPLGGLCAALAFFTVQCGSGWVSGTPGLKIRLSSVVKSMSCKSETERFASFAAVTAGVTDLAARNDLVDDIIDPRETRPTIIGALRMAKNKQVDKPRKRHGVMPV